VSIVGRFPYLEDALATYPVVADTALAEWVDVAYKATVDPLLVHLIDQEVVGGESVVCGECYVEEEPGISPTVVCVSVACPVSGKHTTY